MIKYSDYINEWHYNGDNVESIYMEHPTTTEDFREIIAERLKQNPSRPFLLDIDTSKITDMGDAFSGYRGDYLKVKYKINVAENLTYLDIHTWDVSNVKSFIGMFYGCEKLMSVNLSGWNTKNLESMSCMFYECKSLTSIDISSFSIENTYDLSSMFYECNLLKKLKLPKNFISSRIKNLEFTFANCSKLKTINIDFNNCDIAINVDLTNCFRKCNKSIIPSWYDKKRWENK